jgi:hypothetical protein
MDVLYREGDAEDLASNRAGHLGRGQRALLLQMLPAWAGTTDAISTAMKAALEVGAVRKVEGRFAYERVGTGRGTYWQWTVTDSAGERGVVSPIVAPWPGEGVAYMLPGALVCVGSEPPTERQREEARSLLCELQSLDAAQLGTLDSGVMPAGLRRGWHFSFSGRGVRIGLLVYVAISVVGTALFMKFPREAGGPTAQAVAGVLFAAFIVFGLVMTTRTRKAGGAVRIVEGPIASGETRIGLDSTTEITVGDARGALPYWIVQAIVRGAIVRAYVDATTNEVVAVVPI